MAGTAAVAFGTSAIAHVMWPDKMARWARWDRSDHYQREIAIFDAVHALGLAGFVWRPDNRRLLQLVSLTGLLLGVNHHYARAKGDAGPLLNPAAAYGNTLAGALGLVLVSRIKRAASSSGDA